MPLWLIERTAVPVTEAPSPGDAALAEVISALEAQWRQAPLSRAVHALMAGGHR